MAAVNPVVGLLRRVWNIGVGPGVDPGEIRHIRFLNIGILLYFVFNLAWMFQTITEPRIPALMPAIQAVTAFLALLGFVFHHQGRYALARAYLFLLFFVSSAYICSLSGPRIPDHYFLLAAVASLFLVCSRRQNRLLAWLVAAGLAAYAAIQVVYHLHPMPTYMSPAELAVHNRLLILNVLVLIIVLIASARVFMNKTEDALEREQARLAEMAELLKKMFGRYLSTEVMNSIIEDPSSLELGGERRTVTLMMTDLRGFTALSEALEPEQVVRLLNTYFEVMVEVILRYGGTINEIIGDALLVIFGAPQQMEQRTEKALACAIEMQNAMTTVNAENRSQGLPELEMGIGLNEAEVVVGNVGSTKRSKYAAVGSGVNLTSRIESCSVGGQILVSETVRRKLGEAVRIDGRRRIRPKGADRPLDIYEVGGLSGRYNLVLDRDTGGEPVPIRDIPVRCSLIGGKEVAAESFGGRLTRLSATLAQARLDRRIPAYTDLKLTLDRVETSLADKAFYAKVIAASDGEGGLHRLRFTSLSGEVRAYFQAHRRHAGAESP